jgi:diguanylate cyclase (GGDEF)-like protein/PAS domain S-box-containing protein
LVPLMIDDVQTLRDLQASEERLQAFMRHSPVLAFMKDAEGRYVYINPMMERTFDIRLSALKGKADFDWLPPAVAQTVRENDATVLATGRTVETLEMLPTPDGRPRHWMVIKFPFRQSDGQDLVGGVAVDVTALKEAEERLSDSEGRYRRLFESSVGFMCTHDLEGRFLTINAAASRSLGYEPPDMIGKSVREFLAPQVRQYFGAYLERIRQNRTDDGLMLLATQAGETRTWKYHNARVTEPGKADYVLGHAQDVTDLIQAQELAKSLSLTDELTGLYNRRGFFTLAKQHFRLARTRRTEKGSLLLYADMDGLKQINDRFGHDEGSVALVKVAEILRSIFRDTDIIARIGGDEFVVLTINASVSSSDALYSRLQESIRQHNAQTQQPFQLSLSCGVAAVNGDGPASIEDLLKQADDAMYADKRRKQHREEAPGTHWRI